MMVLSATDPDLQRALALHVAGDSRRLRLRMLKSRRIIHMLRESITCTPVPLCEQAESLLSVACRARAALEGRLLDEDAEPGAYVTLGDCLRTAWRLDEALPCYEMALQLDDGVIGAYVGLGLIHAACNRPFEAAMYFQNALRLDAGCVRPSSTLGPCGVA